jgi:hypothetical protein
MSLNVPEKLQTTVRGEEIYTSESYTGIHNALDSFSTEENAKSVENVKEIVDAIHLLAARNLELWESADYPGVRETISRIKVSELIEILSPGALTDNFDDCKKKLTVISSSSPVGSITGGLTDGGSHNGFDRIVERTMYELRRVLKSVKRGEAIDSEIILTGSPLSSGGTVTLEFADAIKEDGIFYTQAHYHAHFLNPIIDDNNVTEVVFHGHSFAATQSILTAEAIKPNLHNKIKVLADDPVVTHGDDWMKIPRGIQVILGAAIDGASAIFSTHKDDAGAKKFSHPGYMDQLKRLNIPVDESVEQTDMKKDLHKTVLYQVMLGPLAYKDTGMDKKHDFPIYMRRGIYDASVFSIETMIAYFKMLPHQIFKTKYYNKAFENYLNTFKNDITAIGKTFPIKKMHRMPLIRDSKLKEWVSTSRLLNTFMN